MERNWDRIREILIHVEEKPDKEYMLDLNYWSEDIQSEIVYHIGILLDGGFLEGTMHSGGFGEIDIPLVKHLTWRGHDFLDSIQNDTVWNKTKESFVSKGLSMTFELVKSVAINIAMELLK